VLELGQLIAGPFCTRIMGEFGAEVIKIEPPGEGDPLRKWRHLHDGTSLWWHVQSRGKRSLALDLRQPDGQAIARRLAATADVVVENFRPGRWALGHGLTRSPPPTRPHGADLGLRQTGPCERPGFGVGEAVGLRYVTGTPIARRRGSASPSATRCRRCTASSARWWRWSRAGPPVAARSSTWRSTKRCSR
jgi:hypothetical protein